MKRTKCPIIKQLLGHATTMAGLYGGNRFDIPLRHWLQSIGADRGLGMNLKIANGWGNRGLGRSPSGGLDGDVGHATFPRNPERVKLPIGEEVPTYNFPSLSQATGHNGLRTAVSPDPVANADQRQSRLVLEPAPDIECDAARYLENRLSNEERKHFQEKGYLVVDNALPPAHFTALVAAVDEARDESIASGQNLETEMMHAAAFSPVNKLQVRSASPVSMLRYHASTNALHWSAPYCVSQVRFTHTVCRCMLLVVQNHSAVTKVLTNERILPKVVDILGINISCYHYHVNVTPPAPNEPSAAGVAPVPEATDISAHVKTFRFHQVCLSHH